MWFEIHINPLVDAENGLLGVSIVFFDVSATRALLDKVVQTNPDQSQLTTRYTERAVRFIDKNKDRPFFLYVAHSMPHVPLHVSDKFKGKSKQGLYGDVIMEIDWSVGEIMRV